MVGVIFYVDAIRISKYEMLLGYLGNATFTLINLIVTQKHTANCSRIYFFAVRRRRLALNLDPGFRGIYFQN